jgi:hypothetical protein
LNAMDARGEKESREKMRERERERERGVRVLVSGSVDPAAASAFGLQSISTSTVQSMASIRCRFSSRESRKSLTILN